MNIKYYKHKIENLIVVSNIVTIHYFELHKGFKSHNESHDFWELSYADKGSIYCLCDDSEVLLDEGEILFHKPGELHGIRVEGNNAPKVCIISFVCKSEAMGFFAGRKMKLDKGHSRLLYSILEESMSTFEPMKYDPNATKQILLDSPALGGKQTIKNYLEIFLIGLLRSQSRGEAAEAVFLSEEKIEGIITKQLIDYMKAHISEKLTVDEICSGLHYNRSYIFKQFKKTTGSSIMAYFTKMKIEKAKKMLSEPIPLSKIAQDLSFDNENYFSKTFKKITGYTPSQYRKRSRK